MGSGAIFPPTTPKPGRSHWRFYTVPGDPANPPEQPILAEAAKTWHGEWWKPGGGGAVWESISYDPELNLIYFGVGNGLNGTRATAAQSQGDNWFLSSIVAVNADTGEYAWHYQATPGEEWDYDAVQQLILADLQIDGAQPQSLDAGQQEWIFLRHRPPNGKLISAQNFTPVTWASGIDPKTGRPVENPDIRYDKTGKPVSLLPGALGAHSWQAMAFNPKTGLVYIPAQEIGMTYGPVKDFETAPIGWNIGVDTTFKADVKGYLLAWDPLHQKEVWRANYLGPWNGGILTTAGNLVIEGNAAGFFSAFRAAIRREIMDNLGPVRRDGRAGDLRNRRRAIYRRALGLGRRLSSHAGQGIGQVRQHAQYQPGTGVQAWRQDRAAAAAGRTVLLAPPPPDTSRADDGQPAGEALFDRFCSVCHGQAAVGGGVVPDLRTSPFIAVDAWYSIVLDGALRQGGMAPFAPALDHAQASSIRDYIIHRANAADAPNTGKSAHQPDVSHGAVIVAQGTEAGAPACAQCHAFTGASDASGAFPRLAGQPCLLSFTAAAGLQLGRSRKRYHVADRPGAVP